MSDDAAGSGRQHAASAERNLRPILAVLREILPGTGTALEIASGTGQHVAAFADAFPEIDWQPSDVDPAARASIAAWTAHAGVANVRAPIALDVTRPGWEDAAARPCDAVLCINLVHIAPWTACTGLLRGAARLLEGSGLLYLYGPYKRTGRHTAPSNAEFDRALRSRNPAWGVRDLDDVVACAAAEGLALDRVVDMPANNLSVVLRPSQARRR